MLDKEETVILVPAWGHQAAPELQPGRRKTSFDPRDAAEVAALHAILAEMTKTCFDKDVVLDLIVEHTRALTGASGAAIALAEGGQVVCRATDGPTVPDLGVGVETDAGLSGRCLGTGQIQRCDDTETDRRVDKDTCRQLGIRSLCVVPLAKGGAVIGILEAQSSRAFAFRERDTAMLQRMANLVLLAISRERELKVRRVVHEPEKGPRFWHILTLLAAGTLIVAAGWLLWLVWAAS